MTKLLFFFCLISGVCFGQSFAPAPGNAGTTAIKNDSSCFVGWATGGSITRGFVNLNDTNFVYNNSNRATYGEITDAFGPVLNSGNQVVSLGDSGIATLTFDLKIIDGPGYDFAIFENGFTDGYIELAHVEVSSNGTDFVRFPSVSEIPLNPQLGNASITDCRYINNLAGKYRALYGTPFDLNELAGNPNLDVTDVRYVRLIDVVGDVSGTHSTRDGSGNIINDPFPTPFHSSGFDLDGIGVINGAQLSIEEESVQASIYPNPATSKATIIFPGQADLSISTLDGEIVVRQSHNNTSTIETSLFPQGIYVVSIVGNSGVSRQSLVIE